MGVVEPRHDNQGGKGGLPPLVAWTIDALLNRSVFLRLRQAGASHPSRPDIELRFDNVAVL